MVERAQRSAAEDREGGGRSLEAQAGTARLRGPPALVDGNLRESGQFGMEAAFNAESAEKTLHTSQNKPGSPHA
jgi:hypothetical protein